MGYQWPGMDKLSWEEVKVLHRKGDLAGCYLLYPDGTEGMIEREYDWEEMERHYGNGGEFGCENHAEGVIIGRHIGGITLNPLEYILDEKGSARLYPNEEAARSFLKQEGFTDDEIYWLVFEKVSAGNV